MENSYKDLSDKISARLAFIRKRMIVADRENAYKRLSQGIETLLPFIKEHSNELKEYTWDEWGKVTRLISGSGGQDILKKCNEGYSVEWQIKLLEEEIKLCGGNPTDREELSRLKLKQKTLDECRELCKTSCFQTLSLLKEELNISDNTELSYAFNVIADWKEVQHEIALMGIDEMLDGTFKVESLTSNKQAEKVIVNNKELKDEVLLMHQQEQENDSGVHYSNELLKLFREHVELINELSGLSDDEIATKIKKWAKDKDESGKAMIENPANNLKTSFARELKRAGIIQLSERSFRNKL